MDEEISPPESNLDDWQWLINDATKSWFEELAQLPADALTWTRYLRKQGLSPERSRLLSEQMTLRPLGQRKFGRANEMFFRRQLLEQATDERLAEYKARRFADSPLVVDLCCGLGGDLLALAQSRPAVGVDADPIACLLADANARANAVNPELVVASVEDYTLDAAAWIHIDPDRRTDGQRTTTLEYFSPAVSFLDQLIDQQKNVGIKLAPATRLPQTWQTGEWQWLGDRRECKQQIAWFGDTARNHGKRSATAIDREGKVLFEWVEQTAGHPQLAGQIETFLFEPHPTVIAGRMIDSLANQFGLKRLASDVQYLTGSAGGHAALTQFDVLEFCRLDRRVVQDCLRRHKAGSVEIKKRGVDPDLMKRFSGMKLDGDLARVLVLTRLGDQHIAIVCQRHESNSTHS